MDRNQVIILDFEDDYLTIEGYAKLKRILKKEYPKINILSLKEDN